MRLTAAHSATSSVLSAPAHPADLSTTLNDWISQGSTPTARSNREAAAEMFHKVANGTSDTVYLNDLDLPFLPDVFDHPGLIRNLKVLSLANNRLTDLPPSVEKLAHIEELDMSSNPFETVPAVVTKLSSLQAISLISTNIASLPDTIGNLTSLLAIDLTNTRISKLPKSLKNITGLQAISLSRTSIKEIPNWFILLQQLDTLNLEGSQNITTLPNNLKKCRSLAILNTTDTKIAASLRQVILDSCQQLRA